jgi:phage terminase large subunit-like protein
LLAKSKDQAGRLFKFIRGIFQTVAALRALVEHGGVNSDSILLTTGVEIIVSAASFRGIRGGTSISVICDEIAYWMDQERSQNPAGEIIAAVRPSLLTTKGPLICISTPYARRGTLYEAYQRHFGPDGSPRHLVALAPTLTMNPC